MKVVKLLVIISVLAVVAGCKPDLTVKSFSVTWNETDKTAVAEIANIGNATAKNFMVYFTPEEDPVSPNHRPQVRYPIASLGAGQTITLDADFAPLAHPDNQNLANVYKVVVEADPKLQVEESNEDNNMMEEPVP